MSAPVFTAKALLEYARTKPADETYPFKDGYNCALCQFGRSLGLRSVWATYTEIGSLGRFFPIDGLKGSVIICEPHTWGGIVERLEER